MRVVAVANLKGGAGKSTLAAHLAVEAAAAGPVVMVDLDPQRSTAAWAELRVQGAKPPALGELYLDVPSRHQLHNRLGLFAKHALAACILDTPAALVDEVDAAIGAADLVVIPVRPTATDLGALQRTIDLVGRYRADAAVVLCQASPTTRLVADIRQQLDPSGRLLPVVVHQRTAFPSAMAIGRVAREIEPAGKAAGEIAMLWRLLADRLGLKTTWHDRGF